MFIKLTNGQKTVRVNVDTITHYYKNIHTTKIHLVSSANGAPLEIDVTEGPDDIDKLVVESLRLKAVISRGQI